MGIADAAGRVVGAGLGVVTGVGAALRHARFFHPRGRVWHGQATLAPDVPPALRAVAERLQGPVIARLSSALWKRKEWPDVLGLAVRFRQERSSSAQPAPGDQDLLFATVWRSWTTLISPLTTQHHDYLANRYWAVSPFEAEGFGRVFLRAVPIGLEAAQRTAGAGPREEKLTAAVRGGAARFVIEARPAGSPGEWRPLVHLQLDAQAPVDSEALRFRPFRAGRGLRPRGFIHSLRIGTYATSQAARPHSSQDGFDRPGG